MQGQGCAGPGRVHTSSGLLEGRLQSWALVGEKDPQVNRHPADIGGLCRKEPRKAGAP